MVRHALWVATIALVGCSGMNETRLVADESQLLPENPLMTKCRMSESLICRTSGERGREKVTSCECAQIPYDLTGGRSFGTRRPRR